MPSATSFFDFTVYKKTVTRYWPIWASYLVIWLFILPIVILMEGRATPMFFTEHVYGLVTAALPFAVFYGLISAMAVLSHLYTQRSANFFGTLPVRREALFITHYLAGLSFTVVPNLIIAGLTSLAGVSGNIFDASAVLTWLGVSCCEMFFFYTFAVFCGMFTGHILALPAFYGIFNCIFIALYAMIETLLDSFYYGFVSLGGVMSNLVRWATPIYKLGDGTEIVYSADSAMFVGWMPVAVYAVCAVVLLSLSFLLYRSRRLESAGDVVAVPFMRPIFKYGVSICSGLFLGYVTSLILGSETLIFCIIFWVIVGYFLAQMILDKSFRVFKKWKGAVAVTAVFVALFLVVIFDLTGFENRIPDLEDVESVDVNRLTSDYGLGDDGDSTPFTLKDPAEIDFIRTLHQEALKYRHPDGSHLESVTLSITYHTKFGSMSRRYVTYIDPDEVDKMGSGANALNEIYCDRELYREIYGFDELRAAIDAGSRLDYTSYHYYPSYNSDEFGEEHSEPEEKFEFFSDGNSLHFTRYSDMLEILDAVERDFAEGNIGIRHVGTYIRDGNTPHRMLNFLYELPNSDILGELSIFVLPSSHNTLDTLMRLLPAAIEDEIGEVIMK